MAQDAVARKRAPRGQGLSRPRRAPRGCGLQTKGPPKYLKKVDYTKFMWKTHRPPDEYDPKATTMPQIILRALLKQREWLDSNGKYCGPPRKLLQKRVQSQGGGRGRRGLTPSAAPSL